MSSEQGVLGGAAGREESASSAGHGDSETDAAGAGGESPSKSGCTPTSATTVARAFQITSEHSGAQPTDCLTLPLSPRWSHDFGEGGISYPLIADDRVIVTVGTRLFALKQSDGDVAWGPIELGGSATWSNAAYDAGYVYAANVAGALSVFDAKTGTPGWQIQLPGSPQIYSAPTVVEGRVYTSTVGGTLYAFDATNGKVLWSKNVENGWESSPTVTSTAVYACYLCNNTYGFNALSGAPLWYHKGSCTGGGGGTTAVLAGGRLYTRGNQANWILDIATGEPLGILPSGPPPAALDGVLFAVNDGVLFASDANTKEALWQFGDGSLVSAPIVIGRRVVVGSVMGDLYALDRTSGRKLSHDTLASPIAPSNEQSRDQPLTGLGAGNNLLVVPAGNLLVAY
jgi:outer membrane protein assembly factor BamB